MENSDCKFQIMLYRNSPGMCARSLKRWGLTPSEAEGISQIKKKKVFWTFRQKVSNIPLQYHYGHYQLRTPPYYPKQDVVHIIHSVGKLNYC